jgi:hypothetical protein
MMTYLITRDVRSTPNVQTQKLKYSRWGDGFVVMGSAAAASPKQSQESGMFIDGHDHNPHVQ